MEVDWNLLPDELWLWILNFLNEPNLSVCWGINRRLRNLSQDRFLCRALQAIREGRPLHEIFLESCLRGETSSIEYLSHFLTLPGQTPPEGYLVLWSQGFLEAAKGGHVSIAQKMLSFGAVPLYDDSLLECCHRHLEMVKFLLKEAEFRPDILQRAKNKPQSQR